MNEVQYRTDKHGTPLSLLGYGCMRFSRKGAGIDIDKTERELMTAFRAGVNYFDTAYIYPGSEAALGEIVERNGIRDQIHIATKIPPFLTKDLATMERIFGEQLTRLRTDRIDYFLIHHMTDIAQWEQLEAMGIRDWIAGKKATGQIRNIGFSYHGNSDNFQKILGAYDWDFCQIQYNYLDEVSQAGAVGLHAAAAKGIPVVIMEPLRGGKLVNRLPAEARKAIDNHPRGWTPADWAFNWLYDQPEVTVVLSGMNSLQMVEENVRTASRAGAGMLGPSDFALVEHLRDILRASEKVGCTGCRYCMPCPKGVDIPGIFSSYNAMYSISKLSGRIQYLQAVALTRAPASASQCIGCEKCEKHCPQGIPIREKLKEADRAIEAFPFRTVFSLARTVMLRHSKQREGAAHSKPNKTDSA